MPFSSTTWRTSVDRRVEWVCPVSKILDIDLHNICILYYIVCSRFVAFQASSVEWKLCHCFVPIPWLFWPNLSFFAAVHRPASSWAAHSQNGNLRETLEYNYGYELLQSYKFKREVDQNRLNKDSTAAVCSLHSHPQQLAQAYTAGPEQMPYNEMKLPSQPPFFGNLCWFLGDYMSLPDVSLCLLVKNQLNPGKPLRFRWSSCKLGCIQCQYGPGHSGIRLQAQWKIRISVDMNSHPWTPNSEWWLLIKKWHQYLSDYISKDKSMFLQKNLSPPPAFPIMALLVRKSLRWPHAVHRFDVQLQGSWPGVKSWVHDIGMKHPEMSSLLEWGPSGDRV